MRQLPVIHTSRNATNILTVPFKRGMIVSSLFNRSPNSLRNQRRTLVTNDANRPRVKRVTKETDVDRLRAKEEGLKKILRLLSELLTILHEHPNLEMGIPTPWHHIMRQVINFVKDVENLTWRLPLLPSLAERIAEALRHTLTMRLNARMMKGYIVSVKIETAMAIADRKYLENNPDDIRN